MGRAPCCDKANVKRGPWSPEEDNTLKTYIETHGTGGNWIALPRKAGLRRCGKSCRLRWLNYLRPDIKHGGFTEEEDNIICTLYNNIGSRWSVIASKLPGRTDNDVKNYWNTKLKKKLLAENYGNLIKTNNKSITTPINDSVPLTTSLHSSFPKIENFNYGNSSIFDMNHGTLPCSLDANYGQTSDFQRIVSNPVQFPVPTNSFSTVSSSQEDSWTSNGDGEVDDVFFLNFGFESSPCEFMSYGTVPERDFEITTNVTDSLYATLVSDTN